MNSELDIDALLRRGGEMTPAEAEQLARELTAAKLREMSVGAGDRTLDQPVKVIPRINPRPTSVGGYFTQQKYVWNKTPEEMERRLGVFGKLRDGALVFQFKSPLTPNDYENRAYSYLPDGREYKPAPNEKTYLPGKGVPQWQLKHPIDAECIAELRPGQRFDGSSLIR